MRQELVKYGQLRGLLDLLHLSLPWSGQSAVQCWKHMTRSFDLISGPSQYSIFGVLKCLKLYCACAVQPSNPNHLVHDPCILPKIEVEEPMMPASFISGTLTCYHHLHFCKGCINFDCRAFVARK